MTAWIRDSIIMLWIAVRMIFRKKERWQFRKKAQMDVKVLQ